MRGGPTGLARIAMVAVWLTYVHSVFGGIVRITGSGMGCGDHWPKCHGSWIPPFTDPAVMIEWTHRLLALLVIVSIVWLVMAARARRAEPGVAGPGGVSRPAGIALLLVIAVALLGMVTVKLGNTTLATLAHWSLATALLGVLIAAAVRAGAFGGSAARAGGGSRRAMRSIGAGAALAFVVVVLGGLVAKYPGAAAACPGFPLCGEVPGDAPAGGAHLQLTHRILAYLLFFHALMTTLAVTRRAGEAAAVKRAVTWAAVLVVGQLAIGATMVLMVFPLWARVLHQAVGTGVWFALFLAAYLARQASLSGRSSLPV